MDTKIHPVPDLVGDYSLVSLGFPTFERATKGHVGVCRIAAGTRSPHSGFRTSAKHEIALLMKGRVRIDTAAGESREVDAPSVIIASPAELHATVALQDAEIFFVLVDE